MNQTFVQTWTVEILSSPPLIAPARQFVYPQRVAGEEDAMERGALQLLVRPARGGAFLATCALGFRDSSLPTGVFACPDADEMLAVAGGYAYLVNTLAPELCLHVPLRPVVTVLPAVHNGLLLLAGFHHVCALRDGGIAWETARLSWEGLRQLEIRDGKLYGLGWNLQTDREVPFTVDLRDGSHEGGGYP